MGVRSCEGDDGVQGDAAGESRRDCRSDRELRRFFLVNTEGLVGVFSPMVLSTAIDRCELPGRESVWSPIVVPPDVAGLSLDIGRSGGSIRTSTSVDLDLSSEPLDKLPGCEWGSPGLFEFLLNVRHTDVTFDSDSDLLFSRLSDPNPNFLRSEEAFELREPVLTDLLRFRESEAKLATSSEPLSKRVS